MGALLGGRFKMCLTFSSSSPIRMANLKISYGGPLKIKLENLHAMSVNKLTSHVPSKSTARLSSDPRVLLTSKQELFINEAVALMTTVS